LRGACEGHLQECITMAASGGDRELGNAHFKEGRWAEAVACYTRGLDTSPLSADARAALLCNR
jgi:Tetratricopeptide repeat